MSVTDYVGVLRRNLSLVLLAVVACSGLSAWSIERSKGSFRSEAQVFVSGNELSTDVSGAYTTNLFVQQRVSSYVAIVNSTQLLQAVADDLGPGVASPSDLAEHVSAENPPNTALVDVSASASSPAAARQLLELVTREFVRLVEKLETPAGGTHSIVRVAVIKTPSTPQARSGLSPTLRLGAGLVLGLLLGLAGALIRNTWDTRLHSADDVERELGLKVLGRFDVASGSSDQSFLVRRHPSSSSADDLRRIRAALQHRQGSGRQRIVVVGALAGEGASTVASNLAAAFAEVGASVVLVEGDLRAPRLARALGDLGHPVGASPWLLAEHDELGPALASVGDGDLRVLHAPPSAQTRERRRPHPLPATLGAASSQRVLDRVVELPDLVVFDAPPLLDNSDSLLLADRATQVLLVLRMGCRTKGTIQSALASLANVDAELVGVVLTGRRQRRLGFRRVVTTSPGTATGAG